MAFNITRTATSGAYALSVEQLSQRQQDLVGMQANLTAGKKVLRASDDPAAAALAERARTRLARVDSDQRALETQKNALAEAESTLGSANTLMQRMRELVVKGGNTSLSPTDRDAIVQEMRTLRDEIFSLANQKDTNGQPLFGGLGSAEAPFVDSVGGVTYQGLAGQSAPTGSSVPASLDGFATWMNVPTGNGVFTVSQAAGTGNVFADQGSVSDPTLVTGHNYSVQFSVTGGTTTYSVVDTTTSTTLAAGQPYTSGQTISFDGLSIKPQGTPANGEALTIAPSTRDNVFNTLDRAIASVKGAGAANGTISQGIARALTEVDAAMSRVSAARGQAGELLLRADTITDAHSARSLQLESDRSRAEDMDMVKGLSDFNTQQTAYSVALQTYAQIQKLSLFNYLG